MSEKQDYTQGELFTQVDNTDSYKPQIPKKPFFLQIRGYEKIMLLVMGFVLVGIIAFSLGVEKGKQIDLVTSGSNLEEVYTVQVAAFKNKKLASQHGQSLLKAGFSPMAFTKGSYIILCVGKFSNQQSAQLLQKQLQKTYANCRIRRL